MSLAPASSSFSCPIFQLCLAEASGRSVSSSCPVPPSHSHTHSRQTYTTSCNTSVGAFGTGAVSSRAIKSSVSLVQWPSLNPLCIHSLGPFLLSSSSQKPSLPWFQAPRSLDFFPSPHRTEFVLLFPGLRVLECPQNLCMDFLSPQSTYTWLLHTTL